MTTLLVLKMPQCKQRTKECSHQRIKVIAQDDQNIASKSRPYISLKVLTKMYVQISTKIRPSMELSKIAINYPSCFHQPEVQKPG